MVNQVTVTTCQLGSVALYFKGANMETPKQVNPERIKDIEKDTELTARLLGALGLVDASQYSYDNPDEPSNIFRGME